MRIKIQFTFSSSILWGLIACCLLVDAAAAAESAHAQENNQTGAREAFDILLSHLDRKISQYPGPDFPVIWRLLPVPEDIRITLRGVGCRPSHFLESEPYTLKDLLLPQLSSLDAGENVVKGQCIGQDRKECSMQIRHASGEEKSSFEIRFKTIQGKIQMESLYCNITP
jgi:hypothetical protein